MWTRSHSIITKKVTKEQIWQLFANVNNWHTWDKGIEFAKMEGTFTAGNYFILRPKGGPNVKIKLVETTENRSFTDFTKFPLAKMYGEHLFEETENGLKMTSTITVKGLLSFLWVKIVAQKIADTMPNDMQDQVNAASRL
ncbi:SRPBCC family protein [Flavobacterium sp.]|uniref:SRPBCC family protein n=1 Tax=Flavobacterium sp. TaxID=239 RepID=UPI003D6C30AC